MVRFFLLSLALPHTPRGHLEVAFDMPLEMDDDLMDDAGRRGGRISFSDSDDDARQVEGLTPAIETIAEAPAAIGAVADAVLSARAPAAVGGAPGPAATSTKPAENSTAADASAVAVAGIVCQSQGPRCFDIP